MRHLKKYLIVLLSIVIFSNSNAQDKSNPWEIDFGVNAVVFYPMASISSPTLRNYVAGFVNVRQHYNYYGIPLKLHVGRYISKGFSMGLALSTNNIHKMGGTVNELGFFSFDTDLKYDMNSLFGDLDILKNTVIDPYVLTGLGYTSVGSAHIGSLNLGAGVNLWTSNSKNFGFQFQTIGKKKIKGTIHSYFQHSFGIVFKFGGLDTDKDGINDDRDSCPNAAGLKKFGGCPDTDADGIKDIEDSCPKIAGLTSLNGCPDSDNDGIADKDDACSSVVGSINNNGCPDTDADGVIDKYDTCPNLAGSVANKGCPWPDSDGDGILDKDDKCIDVGGSSANNGCPKKTISAKEKLKLISAVKGIVFVYNHSSFAEGVTLKLDEIVSFMKGNSVAKFNIEGYTDSKGSKKYNHWLSERRANAVMKYLVDHGIAVDRLTAKGYGEDSPIDTNNTAKGRAKNRRVEIQVVNKK